MSNTHTLNIRYNQPLSPEVLNKIFYNVFTAGVIDGSFTFTYNTITISSISFLIHPQNKTDIIVRIDTTEPITFTNNSSTNIYLIARYRWENENIGAEFLFVDDATIVETDVILIGLILDGSGKIIALDYDVQERAKLKLIQNNTSFPLIMKLDGYAVGHEENKIPISDGELNTNLNAQYLNGKEITDFVVSKELPIITVDGIETIFEEPVYPSWMDVSAVEQGEGVTAEFIINKKVQPQDGTTNPGIQNQIPIANTVLQKDLNTQYLNGYTQNDFAKTTHIHTLDSILDVGDVSIPNYYKVSSVEGNLITPDSVEIDDIEYNTVGRLSYDSTIGTWYQPIYETGTVSLTGTTVTTVTFARTIKNARVILQRAPASGETVVAGAEKRYAKVTDITNSGFKCRQMGSIKKSGSDYIRSDADDAAANKYYFFVQGEKA